MTDINVLVQHWQQGHRYAAEALFNQCRETVLPLAHCLLADPADAEEAAQDALTYALLHIERYDPHRSSFTTWLHTITVSRCQDRYRRKHKFVFPLSRWLAHDQDINNATPLPEHQVLRSEACDQFDRNQEVLDIFNRAVSDVLEGKATAQEAMDRAQQQSPLK